MNLRGYGGVSGDGDDGGDTSSGDGDHIGGAVDVCMYTPFVSESEKTFPAIKKKWNEFLSE